jgi:protein CpxP
MKVLTPVLGACLLASSLALGVPATASADDLQRVSAPGEWRGGGQYRGMRDGGQHRGMRDGGGMRMLHGLDLTDAQRDQIFQIHYAQMPEMRAQRNAARAARKELRDLALAPQYDAAKAKAAADAYAKASAQIALMRAESTSKVLAVLTPEQRKQLDERRAQWQARRGGRS